MKPSSFVPVQADSANLSCPERYREWKPTPELRKFIFCYWHTVQVGSSEKNGADSTEVIVPDGCMDLIFRLDRSVPDIEGFIVGTVDRAAWVDMEYDRIETFGIRFYPGGLQNLIREPATLFTNRIVSLPEVAKGFAKELRDLLVGAFSIDEAVWQVERYLLGRVGGSWVWEDTFRNSLEHIYRAKGNIRVQEIAGREAISEKQLTRIFYERTGVGTKTFSRIIRFQHMLKLLKGDERMTLTQAALLSGYYDQAHGIRDFQAFCSSLPSDYLKARM